MSALLTVQPEDLQRLSFQQAVEFFRRLLWAEATSLGIGGNLINVPSAITVGDGGVDAEVQGAPAESRHSIIKAGATRYQIKTGNFRLRESDLRTLFFRPGSDELLPRVRTCFEKHGTFVAVLFGCDVPDRTDDGAVSRCRDLLGKHYPNYAEAKIEVWRQNQLCGFFSKHQPLAAELTRREHWRFQTHDSWANEHEMRRQLVLGPEQHEFIENLRSALRNHDDAVHVRVCGQAGIGKTRLVLESTRTEDLAPLVAYYRTSADFRQDGLRTALQRQDNEIPLVLVVDDCDSEDDVEFWNSLRRRGPEVKFISLYQDVERSSGSTMFFEPERLAEAQLGAILQNYGLEKPDADRWARECDGSPRVAHIFGQNLKEDPDADVLRDADTVRVWDRFIAGHDSLKSDRAEQRRRVLTYLAIFKRFGFGRHLAAEAQAVHKFIEHDHPEITWAKFLEIVSELRQRKILQGETTLYITPAALQMKLLGDFWNIYGTGFQADRFIEGLDGRLREWFFEMFEYASISPVGRTIVRTLLGSGGPFADSEYLRTRLGSSFFLALAKADPEAGLRCLERTVGNWDLQARLNFTDGRRDVIYALQCIAVWKDLFCGAARLLLALGEAENETWANNASGVFADLFSPGPGVVAPTEAPPETRFPVLKEALLSPSLQRRALGLRACDRALETGQFSRTSGPEHQGYKRVPKLWWPLTYGELYDAYRRVWKLLHEQIPVLSPDERDRAVEVLVRHSFGLSQIDNLKEMVFGTLRDLAVGPETDKKQILRMAVENLRVQGRLNNEARAVWEEVEQRLTGSDFRERLRRFVGLHSWHDDMNNSNSESRRAIASLAEEAIKEPSVLLPQIPWLMTADAENGFAFGYELGLRDSTWSLKSAFWKAFGDAGRDGAAHTVGGYLWATLQRDRARWAVEMDAIARDEKLQIWLVELTRRTELNDHLAALILGLVKDGRIAPDRLGLFAFGGSTRTIGEPSLRAWIEFLLSKDDLNLTAVALDLFYKYYQQDGRWERLPADLTGALLPHPSLFRPAGVQTHSMMVDYYWQEIALEYIELRPDDSLGLASAILNSFGQRGPLLEWPLFENGPGQTALRRILERRPEETWDIIAPLLQPLGEVRSWSIFQWLHNGAMSLIPRGALWKWVDQDATNRARYLASFVPKDLFEERSLSRELLIRYGSRDDVRSSLIGNFFSGPIIGPMSDHYEKQRQEISEFRSGENEPIVRRWLDEYIRHLDAETEAAKMLEEREFV